MPATCYCRFEAVDVENGAAVPGAPFDLVFARFLLLHVDDPVAVLGRLWDWVAPGGRLVLQDYDLLTGEVVPEIASVEEFRKVALGTFWHAGRDVASGCTCRSCTSRGRGCARRDDAAARVGPLPALASLYEAVYRSLLPAALSLGLTTPAQSDRWFETFARESAGAVGHAALWPLLIGTWKRKPGGM